MSQEEIKKRLLFAADGPEMIEIYTCDEGGVVDWSDTFPAVYVNLSNLRTTVIFGPFDLPAIYRQLSAGINGKTVDEIPCTDCGATGDKDCICGGAGTVKEQIWGLSAAIKYWRDKAEGK